MFIIKCLIVVSLVTGAEASIAPVVGLGINSESLQNDGALGALEPTLEWSGSAELGDIDLEGGVFVQVQDVDKPSDLPCSFWGKVKSTFGGVSVELRGDTSSQSFPEVELDLQASRKDTSVRILGNVDAENICGEVIGVQLSQTVRSLVDGASIKVSPSYNFRSKQANVNTAFAVADTAVAVDAQKRKVTLTRNVGPGQIQPSFSLKGDFGLAYKQVVGTGIVSATYNPDKSVGVAWTDGPWQANAEMPMNGYYKVDPDNVRFALRRVVDTDGLY